MSWPAFERLQRQLFDRVINRFKKADCGIGVEFEEALEIAERVQFGIVTDENFDAIHAAAAWRRLRGASAAKWPGLYFFNGLRNE